MKFMEVFGVRFKTQVKKIVIIINTPTENVDMSM
jgi:hypothetical protein